MDYERLEILLQLYFDQLLSPAERLELAAMLRTSARARDEFWEMAQIHAMLRQLGESEVGREVHQETGFHVLPPPRAAARSPKIVSFPASWLIPISAAALVIFGLSLIRFNSVPAPRKEVVEAAPETTPAPESVPSGVAVLARSAGAVWEEASAPLQVGQVLEAGWLRLKAGAVQIEFSRGARVILEGPAELQLVDANQAYLRTGKLRAHVPEPAHGFTVGTPEFEIVDRGTEFGCALAKPGAGEVHVFTGLVSLRRPGVAERNLHANEAVLLASGKVQDIPAARALFLSDEELSRRELVSTTDRLSGWKRARETLSARSGALVHLDFEGDSGWARTVPNRVAKSQTPGASIVGCNLAEGRWRGKGALEFKRADDRLRLTVPGSFASLTLLAWVRVDSLDHNQHSLLMTEGRNVGEVHWYVYHNGRLGFGVRSGPAESNWKMLHSAPVFTPATFGSWSMVATVFDGRTRTVQHYFNGRPVGQEVIQIQSALRLGTFEVGNWPVTSRDPRWLAAKERERARSLDGRIDEVAIFSEPMEAAEILRFYEAGRPDEAAQMASGGRAEFVR